MNKALNHIILRHTERTLRGIESDIIYGQIDKSKVTYLAFEEYFKEQHPNITKKLLDSMWSRLNESFDLK